MGETGIRAARVVVVDDDELVRENIRTYLAGARDIEIVGVGATGFEATRLAGALEPDIVMMDIRMPVMDGISAAEQIRSLYPHIKVVLLTTFDDDDAMLAGLRAGVAGFLLKSTSPEDLVHGLRQVMAGGTVVSPGPTARLVRDYLVRPEPVDQMDVEFSVREQEVLELLCQAYTNQEIAEKLYVRESTVKSHVSSIMAKLGVSSRLKVVVRAHELGLVRH
ncbi:MAG: response regulator [Ancrocorticia sp.]|uniref:response regulator n=1 Tax=Ancrocorticia sp. TaxID=2593684 RepID=UPI003F8F1055